MESTRSSLVMRLRDPEDSRSWSQFHAIYYPFLLAIARRQGLQQEDAEDVVQQVLLRVLQNIGKFEYDRLRGGFRAWLKTITMNVLRNVFRQRGRRREQAGGDLADRPDPVADLESSWDVEYHRRILQFALEHVRSQSQPNTWACFERHVLRRQPAARVAGELGLQPNAVYVNAHRVLSRVRAACAELGEELSDAGGSLPV